MPLGAARVARAGGVPLPRRIDGLAHWYDATKINGNDGDAIGAWEDLEGSSDLTQNTTSSKPTLRTNEIDGKRALEFDGSDDFIDGDSPDIAQANQIFCVGRVRSTGLDYGYFYDAAEASDDQQILRQDDSNFDIFAGGATQNTAADTNTHIFNVLFDGANSYLRIDGTQEASGDAGARNYLGLTVGARGSSHDRNGDIDIAEILVYDSDLPDSDESDVESYLADKWSITV